MAVTVANTTAAISGDTIVTAEDAIVITGQYTFSRNPSAPFVVAAGSAVVTNLDADKLDGQDWASPTITTPTIASFVNATHNHQAAAGGGTLAEAALALTDIATNNVSITKHGFVPKAPNVATQYLDGTGAFSTPAKVTTLLKSGSGTDVSAGATNVDSVAISGLTLNDTLSIRYTVESIVQSTGNPVFYNNTDAVEIYSTTSGNPLIIGYGVVYGFVEISRGQASNVAIGGIGTFVRTGGTGNMGQLSTFVTNWTGAWTLAFRHGGVTAGGTFRWTWEVFKIAGQ